jgi:hypothetical protein
LLEADRNPPFLGAWPGVRTFRGHGQCLGYDIPYQERTGEAGPEGGGEGIDPGDVAVSGVKGLSHERREITGGDEQAGWSRDSSCIDRAVR